ncbi:inositol monophosphatase family protein [Alicyclobacillus sp. ALC3]|uniref:inositol monophosphatase family protein n=1 Tax=Alicyclobacillus sp. ALC3 TaxID=2796143 RepID=UPI00237804F1|nr:inositol monophosphatase family protein [Alicyclobacillus sp. ALC3]WDL98047.1 inositol monophosphatase [Alicyclobacillus sp. ALC3]
MARGSLHEVLSVAITAALEAGAYIRSRVHEAKQVTVKTSLADVVTDVDPACERMIRGHIATRFPDHKVLGEETTAPGSDAAATATAQVSDAAALWVIDPLDGTTNFVAGIPLSVVSIGFAEHGNVKVGVIYDPYRDELFVARDGSGASVCSGEEARAFVAADDPTAPLPGQTLRSSTHTELQESIVATGFPYRSEAREQLTAAGLQLARKVKNLRALGAAALHLAYVAAGRIDGFWEYDLNAWDLAAGACLVQAAGGTIQTVTGQPFDLNTRDVIASGEQALATAIQSHIAQAGETPA